MQQGPVLRESTDEPQALILLKARAERFGFTCISTHWQGHYASYAFVCSAGHTLQRTAGRFLYGGPLGLCSDCARAATFKRLQILANWKGGTCLEAQFHGARALHRMHCANGHEWQAEGRKLLAGSWCPTCASSSLATRRIARVNAVGKLPVVRRLRASGD